ncbi:MAG: hypothetical protein U0797_08730 [Gemmataceae bacterium]
MHYAAAEEVERLVTILMEITLAGMLKLRTRAASRSPAWPTCNQFQYGFDYNVACQEVIN